VTILKTYQCLIVADTRLGCAVRNAHGAFSTERWKMMFHGLLGVKFELSGKVLALNPIIAGLCEKPGLSIVGLNFRIQCFGQLVASLNSYTDPVFGLASQMA
jgi:hypothetical protein